MAMGQPHGDGHDAEDASIRPSGTPLDRGAAERALSTYVPGLVAPMLPPELSEDLCSLRPHQDRLCVTVEVPLEHGEPSFYRSVIRSRARLTYGQAERILPGRRGRGTRRACHGPPPRLPPRRRASASATASSARDGDERHSRRSSCARSSRRATTRGPSVTRVSRARRTATSPRRSAVTPTS